LPVHCFISSSAFASAVAITASSAFFLALAASTALPSFIFFITRGFTCVAFTISFIL
jgi:hypothetical protein